MLVIILLEKQTLVLSIWLDNSSSNELKEILNSDVSTKEKYLH